MEDFNSYSQNNQSSGGGDLKSMIINLAKKYNGKSENELLRAIYEEAKKGRKNGTLSDNDLDKFATMLAPMLDDKKRAKLYKVITDLKNMKN